MIGKSDPVCFLQLRTGGPEQPWLSCGKTGAWRFRVWAHAPASAGGGYLARRRLSGLEALAQAAAGSPEPRAHAALRVGAAQSFRRARCLPGRALTRRPRAEVVNNNLDPVWTTPFVIDFFFEETQTLRFRHASEPL